MKSSASALLIFCAMMYSTELRAEEGLARTTFCQRNPAARVCQSPHDVREKEKAELEAECRNRPNTEKCRNKRTMEKVKEERIALCEENPKACAARRIR